MRVSRVTCGFAVLIAAAALTLGSTVVSSSGAGSRVAPPKSSALFSVSQTLRLDTDGSNPSFVAVGGDSMFLVGTFDQLNRLIAQYELAGTAARRMYGLLSAHTAQPPGAR